MVRASDIVKRMNETPSSKKDSPSDLLRLSSFAKRESREEGTSSLAERHTPIPYSEVHNVDDIYLTARTYMESVRNSVKNHTLIELDPAISLINKIANSTELLFSIHPLTLKFGNEGDYNIFQPVHTMIYALKIGLRLNYPSSKLIELGLATLLQNIGMFLVPDSIINKTGNLTNAEIGVIKSIPKWAGTSSCLIRMIIPGFWKRSMNTTNGKTGRAIHGVSKAMRLANMPKLSEFATLMRP